MIRAKLTLHFSTLPRDYLPKSLPRGTALAINNETSKGVPHSRRAAVREVAISWTSRQVKITVSNVRCKSEAEDEEEG